MISSTNFRNKGKSSGWATPLIILSVAVSHLFAFGIGYKMGPGVAPRPGKSISPAPVPSRSYRSVSRDRAYQSSPYPVSSDPTALVWSSAGGIKYTLFLASFQRISDADKEKSRLESRGVKGIEISEKRSPLPGGPTWYRLSFGRFPSREAAIEQGRQLTDRGLIRDFWLKEL